MTTLGYDDLLHELERGTIVCHPPPVQVNPDGIDVTIGPHVWLNDAADDDEPIIIGETDPRTIYRYHHANDGIITIPPLTGALCHTGRYMLAGPEDWTPACMLPKPRNRP